MFDEGRAPAAGRSDGRGDNDAESGDSRLKGSTDPDGTRNWGLQVEADAIPDALKEFPNWVCWRARPKDNGKHDKIPLQPAKPRLPASTTNPQHWTDFDTAWQAYTDNPHCSGVGFVLTPDTGLVGIDLDGVIVDGKATDWAKSVIKAHPGYWEKSPSGRGLRSFAIGELPGPSFNCQRHGIEVYDRERFLTVTGHTVGKCQTLRTTNVDELYKQFAPAETCDVADLEMPDLTDVVVPALNIPSKHEDFLLEGDLHEYPSRSEALMAVTLALYRADLSDPEVLATLADAPIVYEMALSHRRQDHDRAMQYLWQTCLKARAYLGLDGQGFDVLDADEPAAPGGGLRVLDAGDFADLDVPVREWLVQDWIPMGEVTLLYGDGGVGKSLLAMQLQTCVATGTEFFGVPVQQGEALGVFCEDSVDELHRRQDKINDHYLLEWADVAGRSKFISRVSEDNLLITFDNVKPRLTKFHEQLSKVLDAHPNLRLLIIDTAADTFGGNENDRAQVRQYIQLACGRLAKGHGVAVVVCCHPSVSGREEGRSGSTAWSNSARSRLYLQRDELDPDVRILSRKKSNYSKIDEQIQMVWQQWAFTEIGNAVTELSEPDAPPATAAFLEILARRIREKQWVSTKITGNYAPRYFETDPHSGDQRFKCAEYETAMRYLLRKGRIFEEHDTKARAYILRVDHRWE